MNKIYSLLGIGLLGAATLSSCKEDIFTEEQGRTQQGKLQTYTAVASIDSYKNTEKAPSSRANVQDDGSSFMWNKDDKVTIWNGTNGYEFSSVNYDENEPSGNVEFTGDGALADGATVWGIYPKKDSPTTANVFTFTLADNVTQSGSKPELQNTMHMLAKGTVNGNAVTNLNFEHLTALFQFKVTNRRPDTYAVTKIVVSCNDAIFPKTLTISGDNKTYGEKVNSLVLTTTNLEVGKNATSYGYMSFFPVSDMTENTELTFTATIEKNGEHGTSETIEKTGKVSELYNIGSVVAEDGYKYIAGKRYGVSFTFVADLGYEETETNKYLVKKADGLINLAGESAIMTNTATVITLDTDIDFQGKDAWMPVAEFKGTLEGNNKKIANLTIATSGTSAGLFVKNSGAIRNLTLEDVTLHSTAATAVGGFAAENLGTIQSCTVNGGTFTSGAFNAAIGAIAGNNLQASAAITDCMVDGSTVFTVTNKANIGGIAGVLGSWNASAIKGCSVGKDVLFIINDATATTGVGGLVGWSRGNIYGSYSLATIQLDKPANSGGLTGGNAGSVIASYSAGKIVANCTGFSAGGIVNAGGKVSGCYSTTILPTSGSNNIGGIGGKADNINGTECYFIMDGITNPGGGLSSAVKLTSADELREKAVGMNNAVSDSGFEFFVNTADDAPLSIRRIMQ
ncbi:hypothetical protein [uncultured Bacteroides sp.]|uniref:hypothetical protein n=1 Tax=uncultured Bacteroides sp. TaxID=162156 RepID=UPI0027DD5E18|nr:hypothetical protein [uncultured Bacteroides sp.]